MKVSSKNSQFEKSMQDKHNEESDKQHKSLVQSQKLSKPQIKPKFL